MVSGRVCLIRRSRLRSSAEAARGETMLEAGHVRWVAIGPADIGYSASAL